MTEPQTTVPENIFPTPAPKPGVFGTKVPSSVTFAVAIVLFFMPFIDITCNSMSLQTISGLQLATGFKIKSMSDNNSLLDSFNTNDNATKADKKTDREDPNMYALIALGVGILGLVLSIRNAKAGGIGGLITGIISAGALVGLMMDINTKLKVKIPTEDSQVKISVDFTPWFYVTIVAFLVAAFFSYKRMKESS